MKKLYNTYYVWANVYKWRLFKNSPSETDRLSFGFIASHVR